MVRRAEELAEKHGWFPRAPVRRTLANWRSPAKPPRREILRDFAGRRLTHFRHRLGHRRHPHRRRRSALAVAPGGERARGRTRGRGDAAKGTGRRTRSRGWTPDFVPQVPELVNFVAQLLSISDADAIATARRLAQEEGLFVGISAGATVAAALRIARRMRRTAT